MQDLSKQAATVYVGRKPLMNYVLAVVTAFNMPDAKEVVLKARGRAISRAVDVAEIARRRFLKEVKIGNIKMGSEDIAVEEESRTRTVSTMEITLTRPKPKAKPKANAKPNSKRKRGRKRKKE